MAGLLDVVPPAQGGDVFGLIGSQLRLQDLQASLIRPLLRSLGLLQADKTECRPC